MFTNKHSVNLGGLQLMKENKTRKTGYHTCKNRRKKNQKGIKFTGFLCIGLMALMLVRMTTVDANADVPERYKYYTNVYVDRDTTLWDVSKEYMTEEYADIRVYMDEVKTINHLPSDQLEYGSTICVPYYSDEYKK